MRRCWAGGYRGSFPGPRWACFACSVRSDEAIYESAVAARGKNRRQPYRAEANDRNRGILDRRPRCRGLARRARRLCILSWRRGGLYEVLARCAARHRRLRNEGPSPCDRKLFAAYRAACARAPWCHLGLRRNRRHPSVQPPREPQSPARPLRPAPAMAIPRDTPAWRSPARQSARSRCAPAVQTGWRIWMLSRSVRSSFLSMWLPLESSYSAASAISERITARKASIGVRPFDVSTCQKVQPLQASRPCAKAPMRWIEPTVPSSDTAPSARTSALWRFLA